MSPPAYSYSTSGAVPRQTASQATSSAFSSSANPDEDWTQISDLSERRRIQNRIAQRNYRKKLKRRLEDLERRAGSSSVSPPQVHAELSRPEKKAAASPSFKQSSNATTSRQKRSPQIMSHSQYTPPMESEEGMFSIDYRDRSQTPPLFAYHSYSPPEETLYPSYAPQTFRPIATGSEYPEYLAVAPLSLPPMQHFNEAIKREPMVGDDLGNPFSMSYAALAGIEMHGAQSYDDFHPHTPPLSHSYEGSTVCSENGYRTYPGTPLSMPPSPPLMHQL